MTDKQIIIDVCPYQGECSVSGCKRNDDGCFVRQLFEERYRAENQIVELNKTIQAKEQECEELKLGLIETKAHGDYLNNLALSETLNLVSEQLEAYKMEAEEGKEINAELKAENDELKEEIDDLKEIIQRHDNDNNALLSEFEDDLVEYYRKYKECLTEIKEIAEDFYLDGEHVKDKYLAQEILQKISEVEDEHNG